MGRSWRRGQQCVRTLVILAALVWVPAPAAAQVLSGSYTGNVSDSRAITGLGFQPDVVVVKGDTAQVAAIRTSTMAGDSSKQTDSATSFVTDRIQSLDSDGFTVGLNAEVNSSGITYYWMAFRVSTTMQVGTYTGNGSSKAVTTGVGFQPQLVMLLPAGAYIATLRMSGSSCTYDLGNGTGNSIRITSLDSDGFSVGSSTYANNSGTVYHYIAWNQVAGLTDVGTYTGTGNDNHNITGVGFQPEYVIAKTTSGSSTRYTPHKSASTGASTDTTLFFDTAGNYSNEIQALQADGFQVGSCADSNPNGEVYTYLAWRRQSAPTISDIANQTTDTSTATSAIAFAAALTTQPTADVTVGLLSNHTTEGTGLPASLTFTAADWSLPQAVTGADDAIVDGDRAYVIQTGVAVSADPAYEGLDPADVSVTNIDDDTVGVAVTPTSGLTTTEGGGTATFSIVLHSRPTADVTISLSSSNLAEGTVTPAALTFTAANWNTPQTVTVTGVDDAIQDGAQAYTIVTTPALSADPLYSGVDPVDVSVSNADNETAGVTVTPTTGLVTTEAGGTATFTVVLTSPPTAGVTIGLSSSDTTEGTVAPASLTFTAANWNVPRTVTVTGVDDAMVDGTVAYTIVTGAASSSDLSYNGLAVADVSVSTTDKCPAGVTVTPTSGLITTEAGGTATFTVVLTAQPTADVTLPLSSSQLQEGTVSPAALVFTPVTWNAPQTVTVTGVDDTLADGSRGYLVITAPAVSGDTNYAGINPVDVSVANADNDTSGITVTPTSGLVTSEAGQPATFMVVLNTQPMGDVTIPLSSSDATEGTVAPASLTFTTVNWNLRQAVTITGVDDATRDGAQAYTIVTAAALSTDPLYAGLDAPNVVVANSDDEMAGFTVTPLSGLVTSEAGGSATFCIALNTRPVVDVTVALSSTRPGEGVVAPAEVTFTPANWNLPQIVTVTGVDDAVSDGAQAYTVVTAPAVSLDPDYDGLDHEDVSLTNLDDDAPGIGVTATGTLTTSESGRTATFTVVLSVPPAADVLVPVVSSNTREGVVSPEMLIFTRDNWDIPGEVTATGVDDGERDGTASYTIVIGPATSADRAYNSIDPHDVGMRNLDDGVSPGAAEAGLTPSLQPPPSEPPATLLPSNSGQVLPDAPKTNHPGQITGQGIRNSRTDASGLTLGALVDRTPPPIVTPGDITIEALSTLMAVAFSVSATDDVDGDLAVSCDPPGSLFAIGKTTVNCSAKNTAGNQGSARFVVTVQDTTPPSVDVPASVTAEASGPRGATVAFAASATDSVSGTLASICSPASGSTFSVGTSLVTCRATDAAGNTGSSSFTVAVRDATPPVIASCGITGIASNQPINGTGIGDTAPDRTIGTGLRPALRAEEAGTGSGPVFTIAVQCRDASGKLTSKTSVVSVPRNSSSKRRLRTSRTP